MRRGFAMLHRSTSTRPRILTLAVGLVAVLSMSLGLTSAGAGQPADRIALPDGSQPEGLAISKRGLFYTGSLADGTIWVGDVGTGRIRRLVPGGQGRVAVGVEVRGRYLWVAGGDTGMAWVFRRSGRLVHTYRFEPGGFINDVVVTRRAAFFTDSVEPYLYRVPIDGGRPTGQQQVETRPLSGDLVFEEGFNANGIDRVPGTSMFVLVQSNTGELFALRQSGHTREIDLGGKKVASGDGVLVIDDIVYVVQNFLNKVAKVRLSDDLSTGQVVDRWSDPDFDVPTSIDEHGGTLYVVNARFTTPPEPDTRYWIASTPRR
jgi:hypothetical protein